jgi:hypothetical protein
MWITPVENEPPEREGHTARQTAPGANWLREWDARPSDLER